MDVKDELKIILRERECPFFTDDELEYYLASNNGNVNAAAYECLIVKSEDTTLSVSGLQCSDTSKYFLRLAQKYKVNNSCILPGG